MTKARVVMAALAFVSCASAGAAWACPPCSQPSLWTGSCLRQFCQICSCDAPAAAPLDALGLALEEPATCDADASSTPAPTPETVVAPSATAAESHP